MLLGTRTAMLLLLGLAVLVAGQGRPAAQAAFFVSCRSGSDSNPGTSAATPFRTLARCVAAANSHGATQNTTCFVLASGSPCPLHEAVGVGNRGSMAPQFSLSIVGLTQEGEVAAAGDPNAPVLSGAVNVTGPWTPYKGGIYSTPYKAPGGVVQQLFSNGQVLTEARWPNVKPQDVFNKTKAWAPTHDGSRYGKIVDPALAASNFSWAGALATLNVAHQFYTWTRVVSTHETGSNTLTYPKNLPDITFYANVTRPWERNQYFLSGKLGALDTPGEWFYDDAAGRLYLWPLGDIRAPVQVKATDYCIDNSILNANVHVSGLAFFGCALRMSKCDGCSATNLSLQYPTYNREILELNVPSGKTNGTVFSGDRMRVSHVLLSDTNNHGLAFDGTNSILEEVLVTRVDSLGTLTYSPVSVGGRNNTVTRVSVSVFGNAGIHSTGNPEISYCRASRGGLIGKDHSAFYTGSPAAAGTNYHHNWAHDMVEKCYRGDDQSRNITFHHNVAFNCGEPEGDVRNAGYGIVIKGNNHIIYANTFFSSKRAEICIPNCGEPYKPWAHQAPLDPHQNNRTQLFNTMANLDVGYPCSCKNSSSIPGGVQEAVLHLSLAEALLEDPANFKFAPTASSPLRHAGILRPPYTDPDHQPGQKPDVGAYQAGAPYWVPGCTWHPGC